MTDTQSPPVEVDDDAPEDKEGMDLRPNGTVHLWIEGQKFRLRRPRAGEFRKLREMFQEVADEITDLSETAGEFERRLVERLEEARRTDPAARPTAEERQQDRTMSREMTERTETLMFGWWQGVLAELRVNTGHPIPDPDDMPPWLGAIPSANMIIGHWRAVPSLSGGR
jgi:hypothetical protein